MITIRRSIALVTLGITLSLLGQLPVSAQARPGNLYDNCTNFNDRYPHGVGKRHAHDHTSGTPVRNFKKSNKIYKRAMRHNSDLDRDRDKIACEKA
jgi:hypothetical protein